MSSITELLVRSSGGQVLCSVVIDFLRAQGRDKRGGDAVLVSLSAAEDQPAAQSSATDMPALDRALQRMREIDVPLYELIEMQAFAGLSIAELSELRGVATRTINRDLIKARALLLELLGVAPTTTD